MNAQHLISNLAGFNKWSELIHSNKYRLELGKLLFEHRNDHFDEYPLLLNWQFYEEQNLQGFDDQAKLGIFEYIFLGIRD